MKPRITKRSRNRLAAAIAASLTTAAAGPAAGLEVTGSFTGWWGQPLQENHGVIVSVSRRADGSKQGVLYWAHYDQFGNPSWLYAEGPIVRDTIQAQLYRFDGVTFMQADDPTTGRGREIGDMQVRFSDCGNAEVTFSSTESAIGGGAFPIRRLTNQPGTRCSGGISDDRSGDAAPQEFRAPLLPTGAIPGASGHIDYDANASRVEFEVEIEDVPEGDYELLVGGELRAVITVAQTDSGPEGEVEFRSPAEPGKLLLDFDPLGQIVEIVQDGTVLLEGIVEPSGQGNPGDPGTPPPGTPPFGNSEIEIDLINSGAFPAGSGDAEFEQRPDRVEFDIEIEDVPVGPYTLFVGGAERGTIEVIEYPDGTEGELEFRFPPEPGKLPLEFDPRGELVEVLDAAGQVFFVDFPLDGAGDDDDDDDDNGDDDDDGDDDNGGDDDDGDDDNGGDDNGGDDDDGDDDNGGDDDGGDDDNGDDDDDDGEDDDDDDDGEDDNGGGDDDDDDGEDDN